jgi:hypothetical protein
MVPTIQMRRVNTGRECGMLKGAGRFPDPFSWRGYASILAFQNHQTDRISRPSFAQIARLELHHFNSREVTAALQRDQQLLDLVQLHIISVQDFIGSALPEDLPCGVLDRNHLDFGWALFETVPSDPYEGAAAAGSR